MIAHYLIKLLWLLQVDFCVLCRQSAYMKILKRFKTSPLMEIDFDTTGSTNQQIVLSDMKVEAQP